MTLLMTTCVSSLPCVISKMTLFNRVLQLYSRPCPDLSLRPLLSKNRGCITLWWIPSAEPSFSQKDSIISVLSFFFREAYFFAAFFSTCSCRPLDTNWFLLLWRVFLPYPCPLLVPYLCNVEKEIIGEKKDPQWRVCGTFWCRSLLFVNAKIMLLLFLIMKDCHQWCEQGVFGMTGRPRGATK